MHISPPIMNMPNEQMVISKVFNNEHILEKIINFVTDDIRNNMDLRLINSSCNKVCLQIIRKNHRKIKIEYIDLSNIRREQRIREYRRNPPGERNIEQFVQTFIGALTNRNNENIIENHVFINYRLVKLENVDRYIDFLKNVANLKVEKVITKNLWKFEEPIKQSLHDLIIFKLIGNNRDRIKTSIGMDDICTDGCSNCLNISDKCLEYGPIQMKMFEKKFKNTRHFKKLIITDYILDNLANKCVESSESKEECLQKLDDLIPSTVTCDVLVLHVSEYRKKEGYFNAIIETPHPTQRRMPREILDLMLEKWNVKRIELKFIFKIRYKSQLDNWSKNGWFTRFRFNDSYELVEDSKNLNMKFSQVHVDISDSFVCRIGVLYNNISGPVEMAKGYINLISNIRKVFPTDHISIRCSHWYDHECRHIDKRLKGFLNVLYTGNPQKPQKNLKISIQMFPNFKETFYVLDFYPYQKGLAEIPELIQHGTHNLQFSIQDPLIKCSRWRLREATETSMENEKWIGKRCEIRDDRNNCVINFDILISENDYYEFPEDIMNAHPNALVRHFLK